ncbi:MAG: hypothetical protein BWY83_00828 [bacterium ADurb.Bin478]|nr:MAG: hypothetical protein BWY83_00828 [bacterium ADurb.Bin478]
MMPEKHRISDAAENVVHLKVVEQLHAGVFQRIDQAMALQGGQQAAMSVRGQGQGMARSQQQFAVLIEGRLRGLAEKKQRVRIFAEIVMAMEIFDGIHVVLFAGHDKKEDGLAVELFQTDDFLRMKLEQGAPTDWADLQTAFGLFAAQPGAQAAGHHQHRHLALVQQLPAGCGCLLIPRPFCCCGCQRDDGKGLRLR